MRWVSWAESGAARVRRGGPGRLGALGADGRVLDVAALAGPAGTAPDALPADLVDLVTAAPAEQDRVRALVEQALSSPDGPAWRAAGDVRLLAPLRAPNSLRDFLAFRDHAERGAARRGGTVPEPWDRIPVFYKGNRREISGPDDDVAWPSYTDRLDYECEVACVVGRPARDLTEESAAHVVFGYTVMNDWSARDVQRDEMACWLGPAKAKDFDTTLGPCVVTPEEWSPEDDHEMTVTVDGEVWSRGSTSGRRWSFAQMLVHASRDEDLWPTDVLGSGTFGGGCGLDLDRWLAPGAVVTLTVDGLGALSNRVVRAAGPTRPLGSPRT